LKRLQIVKPARKARERMAAVMMAHPAAGEREEGSRRGASSGMPWHNANFPGSEIRNLP